MRFDLILVAALIATTALTDAISIRLRAPPSIALVLVGLTLSFVPSIPKVAIEPQVVLLFFLPPLVYASGVGMSWRGFRKNIGPILLLAVGCVVFTATSVAFVGHSLLALPWGVAFILGAAVSPPDPVAPMAVARRLKLPKHLLTILEGEGLANDATALILLSFALAAMSQGGLSIAGSTARFSAILAGELVWGAAVGWLLLRVRRWVGNPQIEIVLALLTPYLAFWPPHAAGGSGVLAALVAGLHVSWYGPKFISPDTRLQGYFVWGLLVHILEGLLFLLMGLQARSLDWNLTNGGWQRVASAAAAVSVVVILARFIWVYTATYVPRWLAPTRWKPPLPPWQEPFIISFTGIRGAVSLAAALSVPVLFAGAPFPDRGLIIFVTFTVILLTLVVQGLMLPWVLRGVGLVAAGEKEAAEAKTREVKARIEGIGAALAALDLAARRHAPTAAVETLRRWYEDRRAELIGTADQSVTSSPVADDARLQAKLILAERQRIAELYLAGEIGDDARRRIERELDLEDARNRHALESATGDQLADPEIENA